MTTPQICELDPFVSHVTPEDPPTGHAVEILKQEIEDYLQRMKEALCADVQAVFDRLDELEGLHLTL